MIELCSKKWSKLYGGQNQACHPYMYHLFVEELHHFTK
jgi:hypothetical protein